MEKVNFDPTPKQENMLSPEKKAELLRMIDDWITINGRNARELAGFEDLNNTRLAREKSVQILRELRPLVEQGKTFALIGRPPLQKKVDIEKLIIEAINKK